MTATTTETRSVVIEREFTHAPDKIWRALTEPHLIQDWLMENDFALVRDHRFKLSADWGTVDCRVLEIEPHTALSYSWAAFGLETVVTWTLTPTQTGTRLRMEQTGFQPGHERAYHGAQAGWPNFFARLDQVLARTS